MRLEASLQEGMMLVAYLLKGTRHEASLLEGMKPEASLQEGTRHEASLQEGMRPEASLPEDRMANVLMKQTAKGTVSHHWNELEDNLLMLGDNLQMPEDNLLTLGDNLLILEGRVVQMY